jgi:hypothetical protein
LAGTHKLRLELQEARTRIGVLSAERDAYLRQRDEAIGERNELLRQRDEAIGQKNLQAERLAQLAHRADLKRKPRVATRDRILLFLQLAETGGALADILVRNFSPAEFRTVDTNEAGGPPSAARSDKAVEKLLGRMPQSELDELRVVWGGYYPGVHAGLPKPCDCVALLRDPQYSAANRREHPVAKTGAAQGDGLDRHPPWPPHRDNHMTRVLSGGAVAADPVLPDAASAIVPALTDADFEMAARNLDDCLVVGPEDQFDHTLLVLAAELGWSLTDVVYHPRIRPPRPAAPDVPEDLRSNTLDRNQYDVALAARGRRHLADRIASYPGDFNNSLALFRWINALFRKGAPPEELRRMEFDVLRP